MKTYEQIITGFDRQLEKATNRKWRRGTLDQTMLDEIGKIRNYLDRAKKKLPFEDTRKEINEVYKRWGPNPDK